MTDHAAFPPARTPAPGDVRRSFGRASACVLLFAFVAASLSLLLPEANAQLPAGRPRPGVPSDLVGNKDEPPGPLYTPFDAVRLASIDLQVLARQYDAALLAAKASGAKLSGAVGDRHKNLGTPDPGFVRYLSLHNLPRGRRKAATDDVAFVLNSLSRNPELKRAALLIVPETDGVLLRVCLDDFDLTPAAWDLLADEGSGPVDRRFPEPYFHLAVPDGTKNAAGEPKTVQVAAPWLAAEADGAAPGSTIAYLIETAQTANPILRADWFCTFGFWAPRYYDFLGVGKDGARTEKEFQDLFFADAEQAKKARTEVKATVVKSAVALANRSMLRYPTVNHAFGGFYWESLDSKASIRKSNHMQDLLRAKFDAKEIIASLPNGMQAYAVSDNKGKLLDVADAPIAQDFNTPHQDKQVYVGRNCATCHDQGMWFIRDNVRKLSRERIGLLIPDPHDAARIRTLFFVHDVKTLTDRDAAMFTAAVVHATGRRPQAVVGDYARLCYDYFDRDLTIQDASMELGLPVADIKKVLERAINPDFTLTGLLADPPEPIRRDQWEADALPQLHLLMQQAQHAKPPAPLARPPAAGGAPAAPAAPRPAAGSP